MPGAAARLGDTTAHGGSIVVGCPTVLVGGAPAARATDMHACPMVTPGVPPIPHVGGPLLPGVPTVLIANLPASCLGDMAICVGPPDSVVKGEFTVLVGTGGGGGAGMGGASGAIAGASASGVAHPTGSQPQATALGDGRYEARLGALRFVGAVEFVAVALRAVATLRAHETGRAALRVLRDRRAEVTIAEGERGASVRVADGRVTVSVRFAPIASRDDLDAHGLALETLLWVADDVFAKGAPTLPSALRETGT